MAYLCSVCKQTISEKVYNYSMNKYGRVLCFNHQKSSNPQEMLCSICKQKISEKVYDYSTKHFGKALCWEHQKNASQSKPISSKINTQPRILRHCSDCKRAITLVVYEFSMKNFGTPLCRNCQPYTERKKKYARNSASPKRELTKSSPIELGGKTPENKKYYNGY